MIGSHGAPEDAVLDPAQTLGEAAGIEPGGARERERAREGQAGVEYPAEQTSVQASERRRVASLVGVGVAGRALCTLEHASREHVRHPGGQARSGVLGERRGQLRKPVRRHHAAGVGAGDQLVARRRDSQIATGGDVGAGGLQHTYPAVALGVLAEHLEGAVVRAAIHDDQLVLIAQLAQQAVEQPPHRAPLVEHGDDHGHRWGVYWPPALRVLFVNQGSIGSRAASGSGVRGHVATENALRIGMEGEKDVAARFEQLPAWTPAARALARPLPVLGRHDLDLHVPRWHLVESLRGRRFIAPRVKSGAVDALHVTSHTPALLLGDVMRRVPTFLAVDVPVWEWHEMGIWRALSRHSRAALWPSLALERRAFTGAAGVIAFTDWAAAAVRRTTPGARVFTICPGVDTVRFVPAQREPRELPRVLFVGGRFAEKGGYDLLAALGEDLGRTVELDVVSGEQPPPRPGLRVHRLSHGDPRLLELHQQADVTCLPTLGDSLGWALIEAMACGTPVLSTEVGAIPELLEGGRAGVLVRPADPRELRGAILGLLADESRRRQLAARALEAVGERFDARIQGAKLAAVMREAVGRTITPT